MRPHAPARAIVIALLAAWPARAQETAPLEVQAASLDSKSLTPGARVKVTGKYKELLDRDLFLFDCPSPFLIRRPELLKKLLELKAQRDNVTLTGAVAPDAATQGPEPATIEVEDIAVAPGDVEVFSLELSKVGSGEDPQKRRADLLERIVRFYERFREEDLLPLARRVFGECFGASREALRDVEVQTYLSLLERLQRASPDGERSLALALEILARNPGNEAVERFLKGLNCRRHQGSWITFEELKRREGFVLLEGKWMTPRERALQEALKACQATRQSGGILRRRTDREYKLLAEKGTIEEGMRPEEVCVAQGFPDRVERRISEGREFDQWAYGDKYCYFFGGLLVLKPKDDPPAEKDGPRSR